jgi:ribosomal RNA-processing protein 12
MIVNIRKRKERSKRKKKASTDVGDGEDDVGMKNYDNELDEVLGSDEDTQSSDDESLDRRTGASKPRSKARFIRDNDDDDPLDLLGQDALANISTKRAVRFKDREIGQKQRKVRMNEDGKLVFGNGDETEGGEALMGGTGEGESAVNAYVDAIVGPDAVRKGRKGRLKVSSGNQKNVRTIASGESMDLDVDVAREVARKITQGKDRRQGRAFGSGGQSRLSQRRGLGMEKSRSNKDGGGGKSRIAKRAYVGPTKRGGFRGGQGIRR